MKLESLTRTYNNELESALRPGAAYKHARYQEISSTSKLANQALQADEHLGRFAPSVARRLNVKVV